MNRVVIAGAGPVGLSLAASLTSQGVDVLVLEAQPRLSDEARASTFHASTLEMFAEWGVAGAVIARGRRIDAVQFWERERRELVAELSYALIAKDTPYPFRLQCPQNWVTQILCPRVIESGHGEVRFGHRVVGFEQREDRVLVHAETADGPAAIEGSYLVGADGAASRVREALGLPLEGRTYEDRFLLVGSDIDYGRVFPRLGGVAYLFDPREWVIVMHLPHVVRTVFRLRDDEDLHAVRDPAAVRARMRGFIGTDIEYTLQMSAVYAVHQRVAETFRVGRVLLAGDAAHINNPAGGMGMNSGIHDAHVLGRALADVMRGGSDTQLTQYSEARRAVAKDMVQRASDANYRDLSLSDEQARAERNARMRALADDPAVARAYLLRASLLEERI